MPRMPERVSVVDWVVWRGDGVHFVHHVHACPFPNGRFAKRPYGFPLWGGMRNA
jgi:hypothetical protein